MRSRTGCQTCRLRKLKCDEVKPICGQCQKGSRQCRPSEAVVFRHQQNASMNGAGDDIDSSPSRPERGHLGAFYAYKNTFTNDNVWVQVPKSVTFVNVTDPLNPESTPEPEPELDFVATTPQIDLPSTTPVPSFGSPSHAASITSLEDARTPAEGVAGLDALSAAATGEFPFLQPTPNPESAAPTPTSQSANTLSLILNNTAPLASPPIDPGLEVPPLHNMPRYNRPSQSPPTRMGPMAHTPLGLSPLEADPDVVTDHEIAFLLRHFSENTGQWMDLFDRHCYFGQYCPVQALSNPLLKYAACAYAAKQLSRVAGRKAPHGGLVKTQADMENFRARVDWEYRGAMYYDRAISLLMAALAEADDRPNLSHDESTSQSADISNRSPDTSLTRDQAMSRDTSEYNHRRTHSSRTKRRRISRPSTAKADETFAAAAILCVYEFLDNANTAWERHLTGTKSLFDLGDGEGMIPIQSRKTPTKARKAIFWNFARQDFLAAFINDRHTRLNTEDLSLWKAAGLHIDAFGFIKPSNNTDQEYPEDSSVMREDMISNALIWLLAKIVNYCASGDSVDNIFPQDRSSPTSFIGINQITLLERWGELEKELEVWRSGLPDTFRPSARLEAITNLPPDAKFPRSIFPEIWYSMPMCAAAMQTYHMARIILLINKPQESTARRNTVGSRLQSYRAIDASIRYHSHEICGISLGRPDASARIHSVQPLFVAGQALTSPHERRIIYNLLREIESDLGWATEYRVQHLLKEWGWPVELAHL